MTIDTVEYEEEEFTGRFSGGTLRRIVGLLAPYKGSVAGVVGAVGIVSVLYLVLT